jgi:hypothetical protein
MLKWVTLLAAGLHLAIPGGATAKLVAWYGFEGDLLDETANPAGLDGTWFGGSPAYGPGFAGLGIVFDGGNNNAVTVPINLSPDMTPAVTIGAWVKVDGLNTLGDGIHTIVQSDGHYGRKLAIDDRGLGNVPGQTYYTAFFGTGLYDDGDGAAAARIPTTKPVDVLNDGWVFMAASYDGYTATGFSMAGTEVRAVSDANPGQAGAYSWLNIGGLRLANGAIFEEFEGTIDNVFVMTGAASEAQLASIRDAVDPLARARAVANELDAAGPTRSIRLDFQSLPGGAFGSGSPVTATGMLGDETWNPLTTRGLTAGSVPGAFPGLKDSEGETTGVEFTLTRNVGAYNVGGSNNHGEAGQDGWVYGNFSSPRTLNFVFSGLDPGATYRLTPIGSWNTGEPAQVRLDSDGNGRLDTTQYVRPFAGACRAVGAGSFIDVALVPDASGELAGVFASVAATNSIGGLILDEFAPVADELRIVDLAFNGGGGFDITVDNLNPASTYSLVRLNESTEGFETVAAGFMPVAPMDTITDPSPPKQAGLYRVEEE